MLTKDEPCPSELARPLKSEYARRERALVPKVYKEPVALPSKDAMTAVGNKLAKAELESLVARRLGLIHLYMSDDKLMEKLEEAKLRDIGIYEGIMLDKLLLLRGQPTSIVGSEQRKKLEELGPALLAELQKRGLLNKAVAAPAVAEADVVKLEEREDGVYEPSGPTSGGAHRAQ